jgi:hypothetical protein
MYAALPVGHALPAGLDGAPCAASFRGRRVMWRVAPDVCSAQGAHWIWSPAFLKVKAKCGHAAIYFSKVCFLSSQFL